MLAVRSPATHGAVTRAKTNELKKALLAYLSALEIEPAELPPLENPVDVLVEALQLGASHPHGFALLDLSDAPYPGLASGDPSAPWRMQWAIQVAELEAFNGTARPLVTGRRRSTVPML